MGQDKILHKRSAVVIDNSPKLPTENQLDYGELAINFADGYETLTIRNSADKITEFKSKEYFENIIIENELVTAEALNDLNERIAYFEEDFENVINENELVTSTALNERITDFEDVVNKNELVTAAALNDLNVRKCDISSLATVATSGNYNDLSNKPNIPNAGMEDTDENVDDVNTLPFVSYIEQELTEEQKKQARKNIGTDGIPVVEHGTNDTTFTLTPNVLHIWGVVASLSLTLSNADTGKLNEYMLQFTSATTPTTLSVPSAVKWVSEPNIEANKTYQVSIVNNIGIIVGV